MSVTQAHLETPDLARADVFAYIEAFFNRTRRYGHLGGVSAVSLNAPQFEVRVCLPLRSKSNFQLVYCV